MDLSEYINIIAGFYQAHPFITVACGILFIFLFSRKPKLFLSVIFLALVLAVIFHLIVTTGSSSISLKKKLIDTESRHSAD